MLNWSNQFSICSFLDHNDYPARYHDFEALAGVGAHAVFESGKEDPWQGLCRFYRSRKDWLFGHLSYDLKNTVFPFQSAHPDGIGFQDMFFFCPEVVLMLQQDNVTIGLLSPADKKDAEAIFQSISDTPFSPGYHKNPPLHLQTRISQSGYLEAVRRIQSHLHRGDAYEVNFCREFFCEDIHVDPLFLFHRLNSASPAPFAAYYRLNDRYLLCASPERFLKKDGNRIISQPIKGTAGRGRTAEEDERSRTALLQDAKERSENVMVVDLVRNDLSQIALPGSVEVEELFGIYTFAQVHQMISTVTARVSPEKKIAEILRSAFPMGSMTGAPKHRVLQIIEACEHSRRGLFSGSAGYITPSGDFDFNVVIRSILYNAGTRYLSFQTGSAITVSSDPEKELAECLLKASAIRAILD